MAKKDRIPSPDGLLSCFMCPEMASPTNAVKRGWILVGRLYSVQPEIFCKPEHARDYLDGLVDEIVAPNPIDVSAVAEQMLEHDVFMDSRIIMGEIPADILDAAKADEDGDVVLEADER